MTREKAIEILKEIIDEGWLISDFEKCVAIDACEMAIQALEKEPNIEMRDATPEERESVDKYIKSISTDTNVDFWDSEKEPTQRWIPVSEGLPNIHNRCERYYVTLKSGDVDIAMFTECNGEHWWNFNFDDVIAWMPLPPSYKGE